MCFFSEQLRMLNEFNFGRVFLFLDIVMEEVYCSAESSIGSLSSSTTTVTSASKCMHSDKEGAGGPVDAGGSPTDRVERLLKKYKAKKVCMGWV